MGLTRQLCLSICLKSSLYELSLDRAHSVNTQLNPYHAELICYSRCPLIAMEIDQSTGEVIDIGL